MLNYTDGERISRHLRTGTCSDGDRNMPSSISAPCRLTIAFPCTSGISDNDRAALRDMVSDIDFTTIADRSMHAGMLPSFSSIALLAAGGVQIDPCLDRIDGIWCQGSPGRIVILDLYGLQLRGTLAATCDWTIDRIATVDTERE
jgi:hypothetical protein